MSTEKDKNLDNDFGQTSQENSFPPLGSSNYHVMAPFSFYNSGIPFHANFAGYMFPHQMPPSQPPLCSNIPNEHLTTTTTTTTGQITPGQPPLPQTRNDDVRTPPSVGTSSQSTRNSSSNGFEDDAVPANNHRKAKRPVPEHKKTDGYRAKRAKNNLAAKKSRETKEKQEAQNRSELNALSVKLSSKRDELSLLQDNIGKMKIRVEMLRRHLQPYGVTL